MTSKAKVMRIDGMKFVRIALDMNYREWDELPDPIEIDSMTGDQKEAVVRLLTTLSRPEGL